MSDALFDWHVPIRKSSKPEYLRQIGGAYGGYTLWELAPVDRYVREQHIGTKTSGGDPDTVDFVWLIVDGRPTWALVNIYSHEVLALDPRPLDKQVKQALGVDAV